jgi:hypothetical protein
MTIAFQNWNPVLKGDNEKYTCTKGAGQEAKVPSTLMTSARFSTSRPVSLTQIIIILSGAPSTGPQYLKHF